MVCAHSCREFYNIYTCLVLYSPYNRKRIFQGLTKRGEIWSRLGKKHLTNVSNASHNTLALMLSLIPRCSNQHTWHLDRKGSWTSAGQVLPSWSPFPSSPTHIRLLVGMIKYFDWKAYQRSGAPGLFIKIKILSV